MTRLLNNKKILLCVCGGIAAYKSAFIVRLLIKAGAEVRVILTESAADFIGPLTLSTLSKNKVIQEFTDPKDGSWNNHVELALWCDAMLIAPATSNTIGKMANGLCDNILLAAYLSAKSPVYIAPAMDLDMSAHPSLVRNLKTLEQDGVNIIPFESGELASGLFGNGRMSEPESILAALESHFERKEMDSEWKGVSVLINAGPTHESIDPVRFIGNRSTGKMGVALANELSGLGADVSLVLGPTNFPHELSNSIHLTRVVSAEEMYDACTSIFPKVKMAILTAAVADYRPSHKSDQKIKKSSDSLEIELVKTKDILANLGKIKKANQILIGFALETENELNNAKSKLDQKNLDLIILNSLNDKGAGFGHDTNKVTIVNKSGEVRTFGLKNKSEVARDIIHSAKQLFTNA